jgi:hypothetical protein
MADWVHPDRLDRVAASGTAAGAPTLAGPSDVARILERVARGGILRRVPRKPEYRDVVLALLCANLQRRQPYSELELNDHLKETLRLVDAQVDHVTCRRNLVDSGFLKRDRAGSRYLLNYPKLQATLSAEALASAERLLRAVSRAI